MATPPSAATRLALRKAVAHAVGQLQQRRYAAAQAGLQAVLARWPDQPDALHFMGVLRHLQGRSGEALPLIQRAIALLPAEAGPWNNLGNVLNQLQRHEEAEAAYRQCLLREPGFTEARGNLAALCGQSGRLEEAARLYRECLLQQPGHPVYAHHLAACGADGLAPERAADAYLQQVFDAAAEQFEQRLAGLDYQAPQALATLLQQQLPAPARQFHIADLGCGTGLCGPRVQPWAASLVGCDLSAGMLAQARAGGLYQRLDQQELQDFLARQPEAFDGLVCADTLIYLGPLEAVFAAAAASLRPGGWLACTTEALPLDDTEPVRLLPHGRYAHHRDHLHQALASAGLLPTVLQAFSVRVERGQAVPGWLLLAHRPPRADPQNTAAR